MRCQTITYRAMRQNTTRTRSDATKQNTKNERGDEIQHTSEIITHHLHQLRFLISLSI